MAKREVVVELQLGDAQAVSRLGRLEIETKQYQRELRALNAEIAKNGTATAAQTQAVGELNARIRANQTVIRELKNDLSGATAAGLRFRDKMAEASRAGLEEFGLQAITIASATAAVIAFGKEMFVLAGNLEKVDARNRAIAGDSLPAFEEAAKKTAIGLGLTERQYVSLASNQKLVLSQLGLEGVAFDDLSTKIVEYADLLGDFSAGELTTEQATQLLNDALLGKTKGLKELGINVKASKDELDALKAEIMANQGVTESQAEALANLELVFRATSDAAGQFSREQLNLDKATDIAAARIEQAKEKIAKELTPVFALGADAVAKLTERWGDLIGAFGGVFESGASVTDRLKSIFDVATRLIVPLGAVRTAIEEIFGVEFSGEQTAITGLKESAEELSRAIAEGDQERIAVARERFEAERKLAMQRVKTAEEERLARIAARDAGVEEAKATEDSAKATDKKTEAVKKLTEAQKVHLDQQAKLQEEMRKSAEEPIERMETRTPTLRTPLDSEDDTLAAFGINTRQTLESNISELTALRQAFFQSELTGLRDFNMERALLEAEYLNGSIASKEDYLRRAQAINDAEVSSEAAKLQALASVSGALASLFGEQSAEAKAAATVQALINTYLGATQALSDKTIPNTFARIAAMASVIIAGLAQVKKIQGFAEGGFTSKRASNNEEVGVVHANEWVAPAWQTKHPAYAPVIQWLEDARRRRGIPAPVGGYASGGMVGAASIANTGPTMPAGAIANADLSRAIMNMPPPVVSVEEIRDVQGRVQAVERISRL